VWPLLFTAEYSQLPTRRGPLGFQKHVLSAAIGPDFPWSTAKLGVQGQQYDAPGAPWEEWNVITPAKQRIGLPGRQYAAPGAPWKNGRGYPGQVGVQGQQYDAPGAPWENGRGYPGHQQTVFKANNMVAPLEMDVRARVPAISTDNKAWISRQQR